MKTYVFKKRSRRFLVRLLDFFGHKVRKPFFQKKISPQSILVVRVDQMGDIVQTLSFFESLRFSFPDAKITFLTTSIGKKLNNFSNFSDEIIAWDCPWFGKNKGQLFSFLKIWRYLKRRQFDYVFDLRGDLRLLFLLKMSGMKNVVGFGQTGGGFLLDREADWDPHEHAVDRNFRLLKLIDGKVLGRDPILKIQNLGIKKTAKPSLIIHPDAGTEAKKWGVEKYIEIIEKINCLRHFDIRLVGQDRKLGEEIIKQVSGEVDNQMGRTSFEDLINLIQNSDGLISNDSGPAHLAAAMGKPVWVIWSGTADPAIWAPIGKNTFMFSSHVSCSPCSLSICVVEGHPCMSQIDSNLVADSVNTYFKTH